MPEACTKAVQLTMLSLEEEIKESINQAYLFEMIDIVLNRSEKEGFPMMTEPNLHRIPKSKYLVAEVSSDYIRYLMVAVIQMAL